MEEFIRKAKEEIPSVEHIMDLVWKEANFTKEQVCESFGSVLVEFDQRATEKFLEYEKKAIRKLAQLWIESQESNVKERFREILEDNENFVKKLAEIFSSFAELVQRLEKDLGNMRKARGGATFERSVIELLKYIGIPCQAPKGEVREKLRRVDVVIPSEDVALNTPDKAVFITCKRTLRERWKQEVPSAGPNQRFYLVTIDHKLSDKKVKEIGSKGLIVYVRDELKEENFKNFHWVRKLSDLPKDLETFRHR